MSELIERLTERCEAYKGQVEAGAHEIGRLRARIEQLEALLKGIADNDCARNGCDVYAMARAALANSSIPTPEKSK